MKLDFKLKNFTTTIPAEKSIMEIEKMLAAIGASAIMKDFSGDSKVIALSFKLDNKGYKLPANMDGVYNILYQDKRESHKRDVMKNREIQATNVAWRILKDWLHAQFSIMASGQAEPEQVLLPYLFNGKKTLYEAWKDGQLKLEHLENEVE